MSKYYLGVSLPNSHDYSICLLNNEGDLLFIGEEERFTRVKHSQTPLKTSNALKHAISKYGLDKAESVEIAIAASNNKFGELIDLKRYLKEFNLPINNYNFIEHHLGHAASAFYTSHFDEAVIVTIDGIGDNCSWAIFHGENGRLQKLLSQPAPNSIGYIYLLFTLWLGFGGQGNEGKTMGLASYGESRYVDQVLNNIISFDITKNEIIMNEKCLEYFGSYTYIEEQFGAARKFDDEITQYHKDIAASIQSAAEIIISCIIDCALSMVSTDNICIAGGVALNCVATGKYIKKHPEKNVYVPPFACDTGISVGAVLYQYAIEERKKPLNKISKWFSPYQGYEITNNEIESAIVNYPTLIAEKIENPEKMAAQEIANGNVVGWVQGRAEVGPRALGNRSILANPMLPHIKDTINEKVKYREVWRPFAPAICEEYLEEYFNNPQDANPYMTVVLGFKDDAKRLFPSVVHFDGTGRVQSVCAELNPKFHNLINEFRQLTGHGMVLNTSFNLAGEPIVNSASDAMKDLVHSGIDVLFINNYQIKKKTVNYKKKLYNHINEKFSPIFRDHDVCLLCLDKPKSISNRESTIRLLKNHVKSLTIIDISEKKSLEEAVCQINNEQIVLVKLLNEGIYHDIKTITLLKMLQEKKSVYITSSVADFQPISSISHDINFYNLSKIFRR